MLAEANSTNYTDVAANILQVKMATYMQFNTTYPGFGGFIPWVWVTDAGIDPIAPSWSNAVPALDNGEWVWGLYAVEFALR